MPTSAIASEAVRLAPLVEENLMRTANLLLAASTAVHPQMLDWAIVIVSLASVLLIGIAVAKTSGKDPSQFFLSGRGMPWWLLGTSMVATTFAADTPNLVTDLVRTKGVAGNWVWWGFLLTGMLTVFNYARLWRKSELDTDLGFYEIRYSGKPAALLRGFRALYLGVMFNIVVMSIVMLAAIKMGQVLLGIGPMTSIFTASIVTILFSTAGGFRGVVLTDGLLFVFSMVGSIAAAYFAVNRPEVGGLAQLVSSKAVEGKLDFFPPMDWSDADKTNTFMSVLIIPLAVQWWSVWYPGSEPGGGGYLAQRMLAAKSPGHATAAALFFNCAHYALRPWPWILVALASLVVYPDVASLQEAFPHVSQDKLGDDLAYPAMLTTLPTGWLGIVLASLLAAYMSTISTHLNWGASYVVNDFYKRFIYPDASDKRLVFVGRLSTVVMMVCAATMALFLQTATQGFQIILQLGAGTGLLFILRWYWWRINAYSEIAAMIISFVIAIFFSQYSDSLGLAEWVQLVLGVVITTIGWIVVTMLTQPESQEVLEVFCRKVRPSGPGWKPIQQRAIESGSPIPPTDPEDNLPLGILRMFLGCVMVYSALFATGLWLYGDTGMSLGLASIGIITALLLALSYRSNSVTE